MPKLIEKAQTEKFSAWELPLVEDVSGAVEDARHDKASGLLTAEHIERIQAQAYKEAYDAGFAKGHQQGVVSGEAEISNTATLMANLLQKLQQPFQQLDEQVEQELMNLSLVIARQLVRRELKADPGQVMAVVHEALAALPVASRGVKVSLHPEDLVLMREALAHAEAERNWSLMDDPSLQRGDCRIVTETSRVEATLERRLATVVAQLFGGEREQDSSAEANVAEPEGLAVP
ncbi:MAG: flagellar assembly protein FliH [Gammaproteobacteria bacterium]|nr:flagellar assembly protein FliH [Gammaproteobacteria bacterium]